MKKSFVVFVKDPCTKGWTEKFFESFEKAISEKEYLYSIGYDVSQVEKI